LACGMFNVEEIKLDGPPDAVQITAQAAPNTKALLQRRCAKPNLSITMAV